MDKRLIFLLVYKTGEPNCPDAERPRQPKQHIFLFAALGMMLLLCPPWVNRVQAQQETQFTQYMFNGIALNPAYAGSQEALQITCLFRNQWVGLEGAPTTQTFAAHTPLNKERVGVGLLVSNDAIGVHRDFSIQGSYAYRIPMQNGASLSMGLQAGVRQRRGDLLSVDGIDTIDPSFNGNYNEMVPEFGAGVYFQNRVFYAGLSSPKLTGNIFNRGMLNNRRHYYFTSGIVFAVGNTVKVNPSILLKSVGPSPLGIDLNTNVIFNNVLWLGASYRSQESFSVLTQLQVTKQFRVGYSYDAITSALNQVANGSHEIMLNYAFVFMKDKVVTPRYF